MKNSFNLFSEETSNQFRILIADDEPDLVTLLSYTLQTKGFSVSVAYDGLEAWGKIERLRPDLAILDLMMPGLDGWELCRRIRQDQRKEIREMGILMLTARAMEEDKVRGLEGGADDYVTKPFSLSELVIRVEKIIAAKRSVGGLNQEVNRLRHQIKAAEENLQKLVHDLKTPLISMGVMAKLLLTDGERTEKLRYLQMIYDGSLQLTQWIEEILKFYSHPSQKSDQEMGTVDVRHLVDRVLKLFRELAQDKKIKIEFQADPTVPTVYGNERLLDRALHNLISNALKYTSAGGTVEVAITPYSQNNHGEALKVTVKDTGIGVHPEELDRIFEPFYRGKNVDSESGVGLGLALVKEVVEFHGGRIGVESELQKGSIFSVLLPTQTESKGKEEHRNSHQNVKWL